MISHSFIGGGGGGGKKKCSECLNGSTPPLYPKVVSRGIGRKPPLNERVRHTREVTITLMIGWALQKHHTG